MNRNYKSNSSNRKSNKDRQGGSRKAGILIVLVLLLAVGAGIVYMMNPGGEPTNGESGPTISATSGNGGNSGNVISNNTTFYDGVFVDDIPLGGLTKDEARQKIEAKQKEYASTTGVTITKDTQSWTLKISDASYTFDTDAVLDKAWKQGHQGTNAERSAFIKQLPGNPVKLNTTVTVDTSSLEQKVLDLAAPFTVAAVDATFAGYDASKPEGQRLSFTPDVPGSKADTDTLLTAVKKEFDNRTYGTVQMQIVPVQAINTLASLQANMQLIGQYSTYLINHTAPRYANIKLASSGVSGHFIQPGETFSFNDTNGERTAAKGYQIAPIDNQGISDDGLGGGVCQVSGTLYNAAIRAGLTIEERNHHSIPSAYLAKGRDATVDYGHYDLKLKNDKDKPVLIIMHYGTGTGKDKYTMYAEIYGPPLPGGVTYDLVPKLVRTIPAITDHTDYRKNSAVLPGTTKRIEAHPGYVVDVYLETTAKDGTKTRVKKYQDIYKADCVVIAYYKDDAAPTPTPSPTATPDASLPPTASPTPAPPTPTPSLTAMT